MKIIKNQQELDNLDIKNFWDISLEEEATEIQVEKHMDTAPSNINIEEIKEESYKEGYEDGYEKGYLESERIITEKQNQKINKLLDNYDAIVESLKNEGINLINKERQNIKTIILESISKIFMKAIKDDDVFSEYFIQICNHLEAKYEKFEISLNADTFEKVKDLKNNIIFKIDNRMSNLDFCINAGVEEVDYLLKEQLEEILNLIKIHM